MPRVKQVTANKDHPKFGIVKGQKHFHWVLKTGPTSSREFRQTTPPRPSQLTTSEYIGTMGDIEHDLHEMTLDEGLPDALTELADQVRTLGEEQREKYDNMPDGLQQGDTGTMLEERADACEAWADEIETAASDLETKIDEINAKDWHELTEFEDIDLEDGGEEPSEDEIESARMGERSDAYQEALDSVSSSYPGT
jgi:hypothetical protein